MIRRNPTLIPMTDSDVQDIRDMVAKGKAEEQNKQNIIATLTRLTQTHGISRDDRNMQALLEAMNVEEEAKGKNKMSEFAAAASTSGTSKS